MNSPAPEAPKFDPSAQHQQKPKLRPVRGFPAQNGDQTLLGLADARQISDKVIFTSPGFQIVLPHLNGQHNLDAIVQAVGHGLTLDVLQMFVAQLDDAGLLEGPTFNAILTQMRKDFDSTEVLPPAATVAVADQLVAQAIGAEATDAQRAEHGAEKLKEAMDGWIKQALDNATDPSFDTLPRAIIAPHLDYWRGWVNYAHVYGRMRVVDRPDRVIILGTNHFGQSTGVVACDKGYETPLGVSPLDGAFFDALKKNLGADNSSRLLENRYDHEREHSIELHIPWIQHVFGKNESGKFPAVLGFLIHDPCANNGESYDGKGLGLLAFVDALKATIAQSSGRTLIIASADLSHIGQSFGDRQPIMGETPEAEQFRTKVLAHDQEMLALVEQGKPEELVASMAWQQNPTRWCSVGNIVAMLKITGAKEVRRLNYAGVGDQQGIAFVTSYAGVVV